MTKAKDVLLRRLDETACALQTATLRSLVDYASYLRSREEWEATRELLCDPGMRADLIEGRAQTSRGEGRSWREIRRDNT